MGQKEEDWELPVMGDLAQMNRQFAAEFRQEDKRRHVEDEQARGTMSAGHRVIAAAAIYRGKMYVGKTHAEVYEQCDFAAGGVNAWREIRKNCGWLYDNGDLIAEDMDDQTRSLSDGRQHGMDLKLAKQIADKYNLKANKIANQKEHAEDFLLRWGVAEKTEDDVFVSDCTYLQDHVQDYMRPSAKEQTKKCKYMLKMNKHALAKDYGDNICVKMYSCPTHDRY